MNDMDLIEDLYDDNEDERDEEVELTLLFPNYADAIAAQEEVELERELTEEERFGLTVHEAWWGESTGQRESAKQELQHDFAEFVDRAQENQ